MPTVYNKVTLNGDTLIDLSQDTVSSASDIVAGKVGHLNDGTQVTGTYAGGGAEEGVSEPLNDVVFVDYDGEIVQQYTKEEFLALSDMPANPTHTGLTAQGWNWTLADAKTYVQNYGTLCIGQNYKTSDGKTRIYVTVTSETLGMPQYLLFYASVKGGVTVNWGDGTEAVTTTANANALSTLSHTYAAVGDYIIEITVSTGTTVRIGYNGSNSGFLFNNSAGAYVSSLNVTKIEFGSGIVQLHRNSLRFLPNLESISVPTSIADIGTSTTGEVFTDSGLKCFVVPSGVTKLLTKNFNGCTRLRFLPVPKSLVTTGVVSDSSYLDSLRMFTTGEVTSVSGALIYGSDRLERFSVPGTYTSIPQSFCRECKLVKKIVIPATVTSIADYAMGGLRNVREIHLKPTSPPTLANSRGMSAYAHTIIYVPYSADHSVLNAYKTATNWSGFASNMQEEPQ